MHFSAPGKVMLTGEYAVLKGSLSFAVPSKLHQHLHVDPLPEGGLHWTAKDCQGVPWLEVHFAEPNHIAQTTDDGAAERLKQLLQAAVNLGATWPNGKVTTTLDFERNWGLGSSSTLVALVAQWLQVDPWQLYAATQNGSGYDLAVALENQPILYQMTPVRAVRPVLWSPAFADQLHFLPLGRKQYSSTEVSKHRSLELSNALRTTLDDCTHSLVTAKDLPAFASAAQHHEEALATWLSKDPIASFYPPGPYVLKSLGAWGGDLALVIPTQPTTTQDLENNLGQPLLPWNQLMH